MKSRRMASGQQNAVASASGAPAPVNDLQLYSQDAKLLGKAGEIFVEFSAS